MENGAAALENSLAPEKIKPTFTTCLSNSIPRQTPNRTENMYLHKSWYMNICSKHSASGPKSRTNPDVHQLMTGCGVAINGILSSHKKG